MQIVVVKWPRVGERMLEKLVESAPTGVCTYWKRSGSERLGRRRTFGPASVSPSVGVPSGGERSLI